GGSEFRLHGKTAVVTGGGSGIGRAIALRFAAAGARVRILDVNEKSAAAVADEISRAAGTASAYTCDVTDQAAVKMRFDEIARISRVDVLLNNAGISHIGNVETTTDEDFERVLRVNVKGYYNCIRAVVGHMKEQGGGIILNLASVSGSTGLADRFAYSTSKGAVIAMIYSVARDSLCFGICCNCISRARVHRPFVDDYLSRNYPGREREMYQKLAATQPIGRMGEPEEVASLALFLCSDAAAFITGT